jgi:hypothetical protein
VRSKLVCFTTSTGYIGNREAVPDISAMEKYSEFFLYDQHAHLTSFIVTIMRLLDGDPKSISLPSLVRQKPDANVLTLLAAAEPVVAKVKILRHKTMAHLDASKAAGDWFKEANVTCDELRGLKETVLAAINLLRAANGKKEQPFHDLHLTHLAAVLDTLRNRPRSASAA